MTFGHSFLAISCALLACVAPQTHAQSDAEMANHWDSYSADGLEAVCKRISPASYVSGLTDGAWAGLPLGGKTYFYKSRCYMELARRTRNLTVCALVKERKTLFGDGTGVSPASCERTVTAALASGQAQEKLAAQHAAAVQGAFKIQSLQAQSTPDGDWVLALQTAGSLAGKYQIEIKNSRDNRVLLTQDLESDHPENLRWTLQRNAVVQSTPLPAIFPIAVSLYYVLPADSAYPLEKYLFSIKNVTLSAP